MHAKTMRPSYKIQTDVVTFYKLIGLYHWCSAVLRLLWFSWMPIVPSTFGVQSVFLIRNPSLLLHGSRNGFSTTEKKKHAQIEYSIQSNRSIDFMKSTMHDCRYRNKTIIDGHFPSSWEIFGQKVNLLITFRLSFLFFSFYFCSQFDSMRKIWFSHFWCCIGFASDWIVLP